jgi:hypothetical protein
MKVSVSGLFEVIALSLQMWDTWDGGDDIEKVGNVRDVLGVRRLLERESNRNRPFSTIN